MDSSAILNWLKIENHYKTLFEKWQKLDSKHSRLTWFDGDPNESAIVLKFSDSFIRILVPGNGFPGNEDVFFFCEGEIIVGYFCE